MQTIFVTGVAGFIGSNFVGQALAAGYRVIGYDALTYAGHIENVEQYDDANFTFVKGNICDEDRVQELLHEYQVSGVINFAAESHVDRSISGPSIFIETNILGTVSLLQASRSYFDQLDEARQNEFRYLQVSTDEVYGALGDTGKFSETTPYQPNSPYSAAKAGGDHFVRAWHHTYGLPTVTTNCSNNYGPNQYPEKLIPTIIQNAIQQKPLPVYAKGLNVRDWIHVADHCSGIMLAFTKGRLGETYCFGGNAERQNIYVVEQICAYLDEIRPRADKKSYKEQITFVEDRAGHDWRYAIDDTKAQRELGFARKFEFETGLKATIDWYLANQNWCQAVLQKGK